MIAEPKAADFLRKKSRTTSGVTSAIMRGRRVGKEQDAAAWQGHHYLCGHGLDLYPDDEPHPPLTPNESRAMHRRGRGGISDPASTQHSELKRFPA